MDININLIAFFAGLVILVLLLVYIGSTVASKKRWTGTLLIFLATGFALYVIDIMGVKKGIDLQGGSEFILQIQPLEIDGKIQAVSSNDVQQAIEIINKRLNKEGTKDIETRPVGEDRLSVAMPGISQEEIANIRIQLQQVAKLEFRTVHPNNYALVAEMTAGTRRIEPGYTLMKYRPAKNKKTNLIEDRGQMLVKNRPDMLGEVKDAWAYSTPEGWVVNLKLNEKGAVEFDKIAELNVNRPLAIIVDGEIISAPTLQTTRFNGSAQISGNFDSDEAFNLATMLNNPLKNPMKILSESTTSSAYGESAITQGKNVAIAGLFVTTFFMLFIYRAAGIVAIFGLIINITLLMGGMSAFGFTLTLPGIAGIILTIGMAVDANVLIYERLREEVEAGRNFVSALEAAYEKAFSAIADSNITTLISAIILYWLSGGLVKGFAITLMLGLISSMIGALIVTRVIFMWVIDKKILKKFSSTKIIPDKIFDILSKAPIFIFLSLVVTAISFATLAYKGSASLGIDFRGGSKVDFELHQGKDISEAKINELLKPAKLPSGENLGSFYVQRKESIGSGPVISVRCEYSAGPVVEEVINKNLGKELIKGSSTERIGSALGQESAKYSIIAMAVALLFIFLYLCLRYEFAFALGAVVALFHDVLMVPGLCVLFGQELSLIHIGALLTIAGYSINDTIVVFDRIRETIQNGSGGDIRSLMNEAICKTLSRTLLTGPTALIPMLVLLFMGNAAMLDFSMPITIGVLLGTFSSIFIASPLVLWYAQRTGQSLKQKVVASKKLSDLREAAVAAAKQYDS
jgi:SecD/SecF fusion protein